MGSRRDTFENPRLANVEDWLNKNIVGIHAQVAKFISGDLQAPREALIRHTDDILEIVVVPKSKVGLFNHFQRNFGTLFPGHIGYELEQDWSDVPESQWGYRFRGRRVVFATESATHYNSPQVFARTEPPEMYLYRDSSILFRNIFTKDWHDPPIKGYRIPFGFIAVFGKILNPLMIDIELDMVFRSRFVPEIYREQRVDQTHA
jgi:hypothetical protein